MSSAPKRLWRASGRDHRSPYHGFSVEFTEYRQYALGDDPRTIDWRVFARSDRYYIKKFRDETNLRCHLLLDHSRSMVTARPASPSRIRGTLAATLAHFSSRRATPLAWRRSTTASGSTCAPQPAQLPAPADPHPRDPPTGVTTDLGTPLQRLAQCWPSGHGRIDLRSADSRGPARRGPGLPLRRVATTWSCFTSSTRRS